MWTAESWLISENSRKLNKSAATPLIFLGAAALIFRAFYCSYIAYFFGEIPTAFVNAFKKLL